MSSGEFSYRLTETSCKFRIHSDSPAPVKDWISSANVASLPSLSLVPGHIQMFSVPVNKAAETIDILVSKGYVLEPGKKS
jgi:hypothetical protein